MYHALEKIEIPDRLLRARWDINNFFLEHDHDLWEFMIVVEGNYTQKVSGKQYTMGERDAILIKATDIHQLFPGSPNDYHLNIVISCRFMQELCAQYSESFYDELLQVSNKPFHLHNNEFNFIKRFIAKIDISFNENEILLLKKILLSYILNQVYEHYYLRINDYPPVIQSLIEKISMPQNCDLTIEEITKMSGYSYSYLAKLFKENTGYTLIQFYTNQKMQYAKELLLKSNLTLLDISGRLGYDSLSHFLRIFKQHFGISPHKFRKSNGD